MDYNNKLKLAKEALDSGSYDKETIEYIFPELKESEDERMRRQTLKVLNYYKDEEKSEGRMPTEIEECIAWLEKQGEQKPAWNEEDEKGLDDALWAIQQARTIAKDENDMGNIWYAENWLKSLRHRSQWKPSDEQMDAVKDAIDYLGCNTKKVREYLMSLYVQLKKLREV